MRLPDLVFKELFEQRELSLADRSLYLYLRVRPGLNQSRLAVDLGLSRGAVTGGCQSLCALEWVRFTGSGSRRRPVAVIPPRCQERLAEVLEKMYSMAPNRGEFLMKCLLDVWVCSDYYMDNARPSFLTSPLSDQPLEYDRYYPEEAVAFEFNGSQHSSLTEKFNDEKEHKAVAVRDLIKESLSTRAGVTLVVITPEHLRPGAFAGKLPKGLPRNFADQEGPYFRALAGLCIAYAAKTELMMAQEQQAQSGQQPQTTQAAQVKQAQAAQEKQPPSKPAQTTQVARPGKPEPGIKVRNK